MVLGPLYNKTQNPLRHVKLFFYLFVVVGCCFFVCSHFLVESNIQWIKETNFPVNAFTFPLPLSSKLLEIFFSCFCSVCLLFMLSVHYLLFTCIFGLHKDREQANKSVCFFCRTELGKHAMMCVSALISGSVVFKELAMLFSKS